MTYLYFIPFALLIVYFAAKSWRLSHKLLIFIVIFEGVFRKWGPSGLSSYAYLFKDFLALGAIAGFTSSPPAIAVARYPYPALNPKHRLAFVRNLLAILFFALILSAVFAKGSGSLLSSFFGIKFYILYPLLLFSFPFVFKEKKDFLAYIKSLFLTIYPVCLLGIVQFYSPLGSPINVYAGDDSPLANIGEFTRITGTFSYLGGFQVYNSYMFAFLLPFMFTNSSKHGLSPLLKWSCMTLIVITSFMSGSRFLVFGNLIVLVLTVFSSFDILAPRRLIPLALASLIMPLIFIFSGSTDSIVAFSARTSGNSDIGARIYNSYIQQPVDLFDHLLLSSYGPGTANQAVLAFEKILDLPPSEILSYGSSETDRLETEFGRVLVEIGAIGSLLFYLLRSYVVIASFASSSASSDPFARLMMRSCSATLFLSLFSLLVFNHIHQPFFWMVSSFYLFVPSFFSSPPISDQTL